MGSICGCGSCPEREEQVNRTEEIARLKERKRSLEQEIAEVDRKMEDLKA